MRTKGYATLCAAAIGSALMAMPAAQAASGLSQLTDIQMQAQPLAPGASFEWGWTTSNTTDLGFFALGSQASAPYAFVQEDPVGSVADHGSFALRLSTDSFVTGAFGWASAYPLGVEAGFVAAALPSSFSTRFSGLGYATSYLSFTWNGPVAVDVSAHFTAFADGGQNGEGLATGSIALRAMDDSLLYFVGSFDADCMSWNCRKPAVTGNLAGQTILTGSGWGYLVSYVDARGYANSVTAVVPDVPSMATMAAGLALLVSLRLRGRPSP